jgi:hypothetical protein
MLYAKTILKFNSKTAKRLKNQVIALKHGQNDKRNRRQTI